MICASPFGDQCLPISGGALFLSSYRRLRYRSTSSICFVLCFVCFVLCFVCLHAFNTLSSEIPGTLQNKPFVWSFFSDTELQQICLPRFLCIPCSTGGGSCRKRQAKPAVNWRYAQLLKEAITDLVPKRDAESLISHYDPRHPLKRLSCCMKKTADW